MLQDALKRTTHELGVERDKNEKLRAKHMMLETDVDILTSARNNFSHEAEELKKKLRTQEEENKGLKKVCKRLKRFAYRDTSDLTQRINVLLEDIEQESRTVMDKANSISDIVQEYCDEVDENMEEDDEQEQGD